MRTAASISVVAATLLSASPAQSQSICESTSSAARNQCLVQLATQTGDESYCDDVEGSDGRAQCRGNVAFTTGDAMCEDLDEEYSRESCSFDRRSGEVRRAEEERRAEAAADELQLREEELAAQQERLELLEQQLYEAQAVQSELVDLLDRQHALLEAQLEQQEQLQELLTPEEGAASEEVAEPGEEAASEAVAEPGEEGMAEAEAGEGAATAVPAVSQAPAAPAAPQ